jgi:hypothetical protein
MGDDALCESIAPLDSLLLEVVAISMLLLVVLRLILILEFLELSVASFRRVLRLQQHK